MFIKNEAIQNRNFVSGTVSLHGSVDYDMIHTLLGVVLFFFVAKMMNDFG